MIIYGRGAWDSDMFTSKKKKKKEIEKKKEEVVED